MECCLKRTRNWSTSQHILRCVPTDFASKSFPCNCVLRSGADAVPRWEPQCRSMGRDAQPVCPGRDSAGGRCATNVEGAGESKRTYLWVVVVVSWKKSWWLHTNMSFGCTYVWVAQNHGLRLPVNEYIHAAQAFHIAGPSSLLPILDNNREAYLQSYSTGYSAAACWINSGWWDCQSVWFIFPSVRCMDSFISLKDDTFQGFTLLYLVNKKHQLALTLCSAACLHNLLHRQSWSKPAKLWPYFKHVNPWKQGPLTKLSLYVSKFCVMRRVSWQHLECVYSNKRTWENLCFWCWLLIHWCLSDKDGSILLDQYRF